jgi:hypothetical protein
MGVAGSLVAGVLKVLLLDVRRPKDGKLKGIFFLLVAARRRSVAVLPRWCLWRLWLPSSERVFAGIPRHGDEAVW